jgi:hypothetical protein
VVVWGGYQPPSGYGIFGQRFSGSGVPLGAEFRVSTLTATAQESGPRIAVAPSGTFVVVWVEELPPFYRVIVGQRFTASGARLGSEFRVSSNAADVVQYSATVASDGAENFVVAWDSSGGGYSWVNARRFASAGTPLGSDFRVSPQAPLTHNHAAVAYDSSGRFVVAWQGDTGPNGYLEVFAKMFGASGAPVGSDFRVNSYTTGDEGRPSVVRDASGRFVVVWESPRDGGTSLDRYGVFGRSFGSSGTALEEEFRISTYTTDDQSVPAVAAAGSGFVAVWSSYNQDGSKEGVYAQRFVLPPPPKGDEMRINTYTTRFQLAPSVAMSSQGDFVVVWGSYRDGGGLLDEFGVFGQRYDRNGAAVGTEFRVNTHTTGNQELPTAAMDSSGAFVVVWTSYGGQDGSGAGIFARRYASEGNPLGGEFQVNTYTPGAQVRGAVASDSAGNTVVVWESFGKDGGSYGIYGQRYSATAALGGEFLVNTYTSNAQNFPSVASSAGGFVVVWQSSGVDGSAEGISAQRFAATGEPIAGEFRVNSITTGKQYVPKVASDAAGNFVVVWASASGAGFTIAARRYASTGDPLTDEFVVNPLATLDRRTPGVSMKSNGEFVVTWSSPSDGSGKGVSAELFGADGAPIGSFGVNTFTTGDQMQPSVALGPSLVVVWQGDGEDGDFTGIFGQRYLDCDSGDMNGDGNVDVADVFYLINTLFAGGPAPACIGDANGDAQVDVADVFYLINYLFAGGPPPV